MSTDHRRLGIIFFPAYDWAIDATHPEREERLLYTRDQIHEEGLLDLPDFAEYAPRLAGDTEIGRAHVCVPSIGAQLEEAHRLAAGGALALGDAWAGGEVANAFALVRPPGHHALRLVHGNRGFCSCNNAAVLIQHLRKVHGVGRVALVDTDVHHGDGNQDIFWHDPDVLVVGLQQDGRTLYPGTGFLDDLGGPGAWGTNLNIPLPPSTSDEGLLQVVEGLVLPILEEFQPEVVVNSAGQDFHYSDPLAHMNVTAAGYARMTELLQPDLLVLEGGYSIRGALPYVNVAILLALAGLDASAVVEPGLDRASLRQSEAWDRYLITLMEQVRQRWDDRHEQGERARKEAGEVARRERRLYCDTDGITEEQAEELHLCPRCPGWSAVDSAAEGSFGSRRILAVQAPLRACTACAEAARSAWREACEEPGPFQAVHLQDLSADDHRIWRREDGVPLP